MKGGKAMKTQLSTRISCLACAAALVALGGCATTANNPKDPFEGFNRAMFAVNEGIDVVVKPIAQGYDVAAPLRRGGAAAAESGHRQLLRQHLGRLDSRQ
ncbi:MAG: VacJ like lipoprotein [Candidatus Accumulibacter sp. BA-94]|nr:MAG: VacJ like lipoprotein [Candidatus Accumulibacter sp. BA-94]